MKKLITISILSVLMISCFNFIPANVDTTAYARSYVGAHFSGHAYGVTNKSTKFYDMYSLRLIDILDPGEEVVMANDGRGGYKTYYMNNKSYYQVSYNNISGYIYWDDLNITRY